MTSYLGYALRYDQMTSNCRDRHAFTLGYTVGPALCVIVVRPCDIGYRTSASASHGRTICDIANDDTIARDVVTTVVTVYAMRS